MASRMECDEDRGDESSSSFVAPEDVDSCHDGLLDKDFETGQSHLPKSLGNLKPLEEGFSTPSNLVAPICGAANQFGSHVNVHHEHKFKEKLSVSKELFPAGKKRASCSLDVPLEKKQALIPFKGTLSSYTPPLLSISQITDSKVRFAIEGKVLNKYGTYKTSKEFKKYLKVELADREGLQTITLVLEELHISKYVDKLEPEACIRVEGSVVESRDAADGGSAKFSLHVDATTSIIKAEPFDVSLVFMPEISIQKFLARSLCNPNIKGTIAFVVLQVDSVKKTSGTYTDQLTVADGPAITDRATLSFINGRKAVFRQLVEEFESGNIVMYVARNIGVWKERSNTLSMFDITILTPVFGERTKNSLSLAFKSQIHEMGYGQEVVGTFTVSNFNDVVVTKKCSVCKDTKVNQVAEGGYCFPCAKVVDILVVPCVEGYIVHEHSGAITDVKLAAVIVDQILQLEDSFISLYERNAILLRVALSEVEVFGKFFVDNKAQVISYCAN